AELEFDGLGVAVEHDDSRGRLLGERAAGHASQQGNKDDAKRSREHVGSPELPGEVFEQTQGRTSLLSNLQVFRQRFGLAVTSIQIKQFWPTWPGARICW